jgi:pyridoxal phosphate enzyme (YggS family)
MSVAAQLAQVRAQVEAAARAAGRDPSEITLIAVSKLQPTSAIREAYEAGQRDFGENYAQELRDKVTELAALPGLRWHAIGPLQTNKAKYVAGKVALVQTLDRVELARELVRRAGPGGVDALIEVNLGGEAQKHGVSPAELPGRLGELAAIEGLRVRGLMCIPPAADDPEATRPHFAALRALRDALLPGGLLSMGMSADFAVAIAEGATHVRVGTAIFGARPAPA